MNSLEKIGLEKAMSKIKEIYPRLDPKNDDRMQHERPFILREIREVQDILYAICENNDQLKKAD